MFIPGRPRTLDDYVAALRELKVDAGSPSITDITRRIHASWQKAGRPRSEWPARSTVGNCFQTGRRRPNIDLMLAVVDVLVDGDVALVGQWRQALRRVLGETDATACARVQYELPSDLPEFVGRTELVDQFSSGGVVALDGMPGIGKTALAIHLGHLWIRRGLVDGPVLFVNLRGFDQTRPPVAATAVLESFLRVLGVPGDVIPPDLDARIRAYHRELAGTRALVVLDNAADAAQVQPLLPPHGHHVVITSRRALPALHSVTLPTLTAPEALELLRHNAAPRRIDTGPVDGIVELLDRHPLALSIIGRHLREHPYWTLTDYLEPHATLALEGGLRTALASSDRALPPEARRLLRLLTLHPDDTFDVQAAATLANLTVRSTRQLLDVLLATHLLEPKGYGHYGFHRLVRAYAEERLSIDEPMSRSRRALQRLLDQHNLRLVS